jgi:hypothetical protein
MPVSRPFNEEVLWKSAMERSGNTRTPTPKEPMVLPKINSLVGGTIPDTNNIHEDRIKRNASNSAIYWEQVAKRNASYREKYRYPLEEERYFAEQFRSTIGLEKGTYVFKKLWYHSIN